MNQPNIKTLICLPFDALVPVTDNMTAADKEMFIYVSSIPTDLQKQNPEHYKALQNIAGFKNIEQQLQNFTVNICVRTKLWLAYIQKQHAGIGFVYLCYIQYKANKANMPEVDFTWLCEKLFAYGFVTYQQLLPLVDVVATHNLFNNKEALKAINFTKDELDEYYSAKGEISSKHKAEGGKQGVESANKKQVSIMNLLNNPGFLNQFKK